MEGAASSQAGNDSRLDCTWRVAILYVALTLLLAYPLVLHLAGSVLSVSPDTDLFMWTLSWDTHAFTHQPLSIFDANIYYPQRHTLAYSENLIGSALFAAPILWLTDNPVLAMNVVALLSVVLCGLGAYVLARRVGIGMAAATLSGLIFAFSPPRFLRLDQLHLTTIQWVPFGLASLHSYLDTGRPLDLRLTAAFFTLQALSSGHGAVFLTMASLGLVGYRLVLGERMALITRLRDLGIPGALMLAPAVLICFPYRSVQVEMGLMRSLEGWAGNASDFLASPTYLHTYLLSLVGKAQINETAWAFLFPGYLPLLLAAAAFWRRGARPTVRPPTRRVTLWTRFAAVLDVVVLVCLAVGVCVAATGAIRLRVGTSLLFSARDARRAWFFCALCATLRIAIAKRAPFAVVRRWRAWLQALRQWASAYRQDMTTFYGLLTLVSVWLSLGPPFGLWSFVYWLPGLNFIRVPSRFTLLALLGLAVLAGTGFERLTKRVAPEKSLLLATIVGALLVAEFAVPLSTTPYHVEAPALDRWLAQQQKPFTVAEVPLANPENLGAWERRHTAYMLHSMAHWQKTVHGYSGLRPSLHVELYSQLAGFPDDKSLRTLTELGVDYVVVHTDLYSSRDWAEVKKRIELFRDWLRPEHAVDAGLVYSLRHPSIGSEHE